MISGMAVRNSLCDTCVCHGIPARALELPVLSGRADTGNVRKPSEIKVVEDECGWLCKNGQQSEVEWRARRLAGSHSGGLFKRPAAPQPGRSGLTGAAPRRPSRADGQTEMLGSANLSSIPRHFVEARMRQLLEDATEAVSRSTLPPGACFVSAAGA
jgi:hypothetical protein